DAIGGDTVGGKRCDEIQEQSFADSVRGCGEPVLVGDIHRAVQVDLKELFYTSVVARPVARTLAPSAVAFIHQEFVIVDGQNLADAASGREQVRVLVSDSTGDVDGDDAQKIHGGTALGSVLDQRVLHDPYQRVAVGSDRQTFHALICRSSNGVADDFIVADRMLVRHIKLVRQRVRAEP